MILTLLGTIVFLTGTKSANVSGSYTIKVIVKGSALRLILNLPIPSSYTDCTTSQKLLRWSHSEDPSPYSVKTVRRGKNSFLQIQYRRIKHGVVKARIDFEVRRSVNLDGLKSELPCTGKVRRTERVRPDDDEIIKLSRRLFTGKTCLKDMIDALVYYTAENVLYFDEGCEDALNTLHHNQGNCMGISALAVSLLGASGTKARLVAGISIPDRERFEFVEGGAIYTFSSISVEGLHQWVEAKGEKCGWCEFEPQGVSCFVPIGYIRLATGEEGVDYPELIQYSYRRREPEIKYSIETGGNIEVVKNSLRVADVERRGKSLILNQW